MVTGESLGVYGLVREGKVPSRVRRVSSLDGWFVICFRTKLLSGLGILVNVCESIVL